MKIPVPDEFSFDLCMTFLQRSPRELLHRCMDNKVRKLLRVDGMDVLFELSDSKNNHLEINVLNGIITEHQKTNLIAYVRE